MPAPGQMGRSASTTLISGIDAAALAATAAIFVWKLHPLLTRSPLAGWDLTPHFYLFERMIGYLKQGRFSGYNPCWSGGYPEFDLYPPFFHAMIAAVKVVLSLDSRLVFNTAVFLLPFFLALSLFFAAKLSFGRRAGAFGLLMALLSLAFPPELRNFGIGLPALLQMGLVTNYFSLSLVVLFLGFLASLEKAPAGRLRAAASGILLAAAITSHFACGIFCLFALFCFLASAPKRHTGKTLIVVTIGAVLSSWWWIGFLRHLSFASIYSSGMPPEFPDPLAVLLPLAESFWKIGCNAVLDLKPFSAATVTVPGFIINFPYSGFIVFLACTAGTVSLWRQQRLFLPAVLILSILILPRGLWAELSPLPFHFARFMQPIAAAALLVSAEGLRSFAAHRNRFHAACSALFAAVVSIVLITDLKPLTAAEACVSPVATRLPPSVFQERYPSYADAVSLVKKICAGKLTGRIAVENGRELAAVLGSPHFFSTFLPLSCEAEVVPGFLAESSKSDFYVAAVMNAMGSALILSDELNRYSAALSKKSSAELLEMLSMFDVRYVLASSRKMITSLRSHPELAEVRLEEAQGVFFELKKAAARAEPFRYKPFFFVDAGGPSFDEFARFQFSSPELRYRPVLYSGKKFEELPAPEQAAFEGIVLSTRALTDKPRIADKKVVILNRLDDPSFVTELTSAQPALDETGESGAEISQHKIRLHMADTVGIFIQTGTDPDWHAVSGVSSVFIASPNRLAVIGSGEAELALR